VRHAIARTRHYPLKSWYFRSTFLTGGDTTRPKMSSRGVRWGSAMKLTLNRIDTLKCPEGKRDMLVFDGEQRGLGVRVTAGGSKTYLAQYNWHGQKRRVPLGSCSALSLAKARDAVRAIMGDVAKGIDPVTERKKAKAYEALTLSALLSDWQALHLASKRPSYAAEALRALRSAFARYLDLPAADLNRVPVVKRLDAMSRKGSAAMAARTAAYGKAAYGWGVKRGALSENPFANLPVAPTLKRERVLTDDELAAIWRATDGPGPFNAIVRMAILTGQRRDEVAGMTWAEVSDIAWTIPASRTKKRRNPFSSAVRASARLAARSATLWRSGIPRLYKIKNSARKCPASAPMRHIRRVEEGRFSGSS